MGPGTHRNKFYTIDGVQFEGADSATFSSGRPATDDSIQDKIYEELLDSLDIEAGQIEVMVKEGVATLEGNVLSLEVKDEAQTIVHRVPGVVDVVNHLRPYVSIEKTMDSSDLRDNELGS